MDHGLAGQLSSFGRVVTETDPNAGAFHAVPLAEYTEVATFGQKVAANLMGALGLLCLLLAASGLYSVMAYTVSQRIPEIGIRMAMGARPWNVIAMVVRQGMALSLAGIAAGTVAAFAAARLIANMLFRVDAADPATFLVAGLFLAAVTVLTNWLHAFRATRIGPRNARRRLPPRWGSLQPANARLRSLFSRSGVRLQFGGFATEPTYLAVDSSAASFAAA